MSNENKWLEIIKETLENAEMTGTALDHEVFLGIAFDKKTRKIIHGLLHIY